jgi:hypothetical protein
VKVLRFADRHPVAVLLIMAVVSYGGLIIWSVERSSPLLLARAVPSDRIVIYGQFASSAVALLAVSLTVLAILLALPDRGTLEELRASSAWPRLQATLLSAALLCVIALVAAHLGAAIDDQPKGKQWLDLLAISSGCMAVIAVVLGGVVFALFLRASQQPPDPSEGRGRR